jgi:hypothetical protein
MDVRVEILDESLVKLIFNCLVTRIWLAEFHPPMCQKEDLASKLPPTILCRYILKKKTDLEHFQLK